MTKYYTTKDGRIQFIKKGLPPESIPGYEVDPGDPYMFHPILVPCAARTYRNMGEAECCPIGRFIRHCSKFHYYNMTPEMCSSCAEAGNHVPLGLDKLKSDSQVPDDKSHSA